MLAVVPCQMLLGNLLKSMEGVMLIPSESFKKLDGYFLRERILENHIHDGVGRGFPWLYESCLYFLTSLLPDQYQKKMGKSLNDRHLPVVFRPSGLYDLDILTFCGIQYFPDQRSTISRNRHFQVVFRSGTEKKVEIGGRIRRSRHDSGEIHDLGKGHPFMIQQMSYQLFGCRNQHNHQMLPRRFRGYHSSSDEILGMLPKYAVYSSHNIKRKKIKTPSTGEGVHIFLKDSSSKTLYTHSPAPEWVII